MIFMISDKSQMVQKIYCFGCENRGPSRVNYDGHFSKEKVNERTKEVQFEGRFAWNVCYNTEMKIYPHSLEEARQKKKVRPINEVVDVGRDRECEEGEEISVDTGAGDMNMNAVDDGLKQKKWQF